MVTYLLWNAMHTQDWGGYRYELDTPRSVGMLVRGPAGQQVLYRMTFGAGVTVVTGAGPCFVERGTADKEFEDYESLQAALPPMLQDHGRQWTLNGVKVTPEMLLKLDR